MPALPTRLAALTRYHAPLLWVLAAFLLLSTVYAATGGRTYILLDDNLDSELNVPYALLREGKALDYRVTTVVEHIMNGVPRNVLRPGLQPVVGLMALFTPLPAYLLHELLVRLVGLVSMYLLVRRFGPEEEVPSSSGDEWRWLSAGLALSWAVLPAYTIYGVSVLGQPVVVLVLLRLYRGPGRWYDWAVLVGFALWSSLVMAGVFVLGVAGLGLLLDAVRRRRVTWRPWWGLVVLGVSYLVVEYPLVLALLIKRQYVPHRLEFDYARLATPGVGAGLRSSAQYFLLGQYHSGLFLRVVPLAAALLAVALARGPRRRQLAVRLLGALAVLAAAAVFCGYYPQLVGKVQDVVPALRTFNLTRIHFLLPLLWFAVLAYSVRALPAGRLRTGLVLAQLGLGLAMNTEWTLNLRRHLGQPLPEPTYAAYVAPELFARVRQDIAARTGQAPARYRVACLGLPPGVAVLNDFYTLDSYQNNYPLAYKHQFRPLIAGELAKSPELRTYFDAWGNRCYLFSAELGKNFRVGALPLRTVQHWAFNAAAFRSLGGRYVLAAAQLARPAESGLRLVGEYTAPGAYWHVWLYEVA